MTVDWSEEKPSLELVKQTVTLPEVCEMLGIDVGADGKIVSPYNPDERTPSCHIWDDHFYCFSTGKGGDLVDLVQAFQPEKTLNKIVWDVWQKALKAGKEPGDVEKAVPRQLMDFTKDLSNGTPSMGFESLNPPSNCRLDYDGNLLIPHQDETGVYGVKVRRYRDGSKDAWPGSQFGHRLYDPYGWTATNLETYCVITEGESDCWALDRLIPGNVYALPSGAGTWRDQWLTDLEDYSFVLICTDNDKAGKAAREKITSKVGYLRAEQLMVPWAFNDARKAIAGGWKPEHHYL